LAEEERKARPGQRTEGRDGGAATIRGTASGEDNGSGRTGTDQAERVGPAEFERDGSSRWPVSRSLYPPVVAASPSSRLPAR
jgi:hypothetical protein